MAWFSAAEAKFLLDATFALFWSKLRDFDGIYDHSVGVVDLCIRGVGKGVVGLVGGFRVSPGDVIDPLPLGLEGDSFLVPVVDGRGDSVHRHDVVHQRGRNSCREVSNQDVGVGDVGKGYVIFEGRNVLCQGGGIRVVFRIFHHSLGG